MKKVFLFIIIVAALTGCTAPELTIAPFRHVMFVDYEEIRSYGVEVTNGDMPDGAIPLGPYVETVCYGRQKVRRGQTEESEAFPNNPVFKRKNINVGSQESDLKQLNKSIAEEIKKVGGDGIAKFSVRQTYMSEMETDLTIIVPVYSIEGVIYKNK